MSIDASKSSPWTELEAAVDDFTKCKEKQNIICNVCKLDTVACKWSRNSGVCACPHECENQQPVYR